MRSSTKIWLAVAISLILIGVIVIGGVMTVLRWDIKKLSTNKYETNEYAIEGDYSSILVVADTADIELVPCEIGQARVVCYEQQNAKHSVSVKDGTLAIEVVDQRKWYDHIGISFGAPKVTVYIPAGEYGALSVRLSTGGVTVPNDFQFESLDISASTGAVNSAASATGTVKIKTTTGYIRVENVSAGAVELSVSTGRVTVSRVSCEGNVSLNVSTGKAYLSDMSCQDLTSSGSTGDISMENVTVAGQMSIERTTGDIELDDCDAATLWIKTSTGDIEGSLRTEKVFITKTSTGRVRVPASVAGGRCELTTSTGDIEFEIR